MYGTEPGFKKWFAEMPEVRQQVFLATKEPVRSIGDAVKNVDQRLQALGTDYIDLLYYHGLGRGSGRLGQKPGDEEGDRGDQENREGAVRGLHHPRRRRHGRPAPGGRRRGIRRRDHAVLRPLARQRLRSEQGHGRLLRKTDRPGGNEAVRGARRASGEVYDKAPVLKERGLNPHQALLHAAWTDERLACVCTAMTNTDQVRQNIEAARKFEPLKVSQILGLRDAVLAAGPMMCGNCDGSCGRAGGTKARLGDLTRMLTYHEHHGARVMAREEYAGLTEAERDWHDVDLESARDACHSHLDFAKLLPQVDKFLA